MKCCFGGNKSPRAESSNHSSQRNGSFFNQNQKIRKSSKYSSRNPREADYAVQSSKVKISQLKQSIKLLNFKIDDDKGITFTPTINTFRYDSLLSHGMYNANINSKGQ